MSGPQHGTPAGAVNSCGAAAPCVREEDAAPAVAPVGAFVKSNRTSSESACEPPFFSPRSDSEESPTRSPSFDPFVDILYRVALGELELRPEKTLTL